MAEENIETPDLQQQVEYLRGLAQIVADAGLSELEIESDGLKFTLKGATLAPTEVVASHLSPVYAAPSAAASAVSATAAKGSEEKFTPLVSPMVGVFYRAPSPNDANFVEVGDRVERGQTIGLVEAMKVFNEITAESGGIVAKIAVESGQLVETGQALVLLQ